MIGLDETGKRNTLAYLKILTREFDLFISTKGADVVMARQHGAEFLDYLTLHTSSPSEARDVVTELISVFA